MLAKLLPVTSIGPSMQNMLEYALSPIGDFINTSLQNKTRKSKAFRFLNGICQSLFSTAFLFSVYACLQVCLHTMFVPGVLERPEESDRYPKIGVTVNCHVGAENQTSVLWKSSQCSLLLISPMGKAEDVKDVEFI